MSDINQKYFSGLLDVLTQSGIQPRNTKEARKAYSENFQIIDTWHHGTVTIESVVKVLMASKTIAVDVTLKPKHKDKDSAKEANDYFLILGEDQQLIGEIIRVANLDWNDSPARERQIILNVAGDPTEKSDWPRQHALLAARLVGFRIAFEPRIEHLP
jgi:hypothetical protein